MPKTTPCQSQWQSPNTVPVTWMRQFRYMSRLFERIIDVPGDVVECGLGEGNTFSMLAYLVGSESLTHKSTRSLWGFDSFQGFPEPSPFDQSPREPKKGEWKVSRESITQRLIDSGVHNTFPEIDIRIVGGFLNKSLPDFSGQAIVYLHIDVDLYEGYRDALNHLFPKVSPGGVVLLDEYREYHPDDPAYGDREKWPGCTRAVDEYFADKPEQVICYDAEAGKYFLVKK